MELLWTILIFVGACLYGNLLEWVVHKYVLHYLGMKKVAFREHWHRHHRNVRLHGYGDPDYLRWTWEWEGRLSEIAGLLLLAFLHLPLVFISPVFYAGLFFWMTLYYCVHWVSHRWPELGAKLFPWHWDHHMGKDQNKNWCVTVPLWDWILGTRVLYSKHDYRKE